MHFQSADQRNTQGFARYLAGQSRSAGAPVISSAVLSATDYSRAALAIAISFAASRTI